MKATWESLKENRKTTIPDKDICVIKSINLEKLLYHHLWTSTAIQTTGAAFMYDMVCYMNQYIPFPFM